MSIELIEAEWRLYASVNYAIIGSDNGLSPVRWQPIIWTHDGLLSIWPKGTYFIEILLEIQKFSFKKMYLKYRLQKWRPSCPGLNELTHLVLRWEHSWRNRSIPWLLMPWLIVSLGYQQPCLCNMVLVLNEERLLPALLSQYWKMVSFFLGSWWHHQMETFSALLAFCEGNSQVTGEFPSQRPEMQSFDVFFDLRLNKRLSKQSWDLWFEMPLHSLWRHCNVDSVQQVVKYPYNMVRYNMILHTSLQEFS